MSIFAFEMPLLGRDGSCQNSAADLLSLTDDLIKERFGSDSVRTPRRAIRSVSGDDQSDELFIAVGCVSEIFLEITNSSSVLWNVSQVNMERLAHCSEYGDNKFHSFVYNRRLIYLWDIKLRIFSFKLMNFPF